MITEELIRNALKNAIDPTFGKNIVELNQIRNIYIIDVNSVVLEILMRTHGVYQKEIEKNIRKALQDFNLKTIQVKFTVEITKPVPPMDYGPPGMKTIDHMPSVRNIIAVGSNKGGVGKSTVSANITCALHKLGAKVALLDLDLYGPNIPTMFGITEKRARYNKETDGKIRLIQQYDIPMMSIGFILPTDDTAVTIRAPLANQLIMEFLGDINWGEIDYLVVDLPPGTGDIQLTLAQQLPNTSLLYVTTPQQVALADVYKGIRMFMDDAIKLPILGIIENMSYFIGDDGKKYHIFGTGGAKKVSEDFNIKLYGEIPLVQEIREQGDIGKPIVLSNENHAVSQQYMTIAKDLTVDLAKNNFYINNERKNKVYMELEME